MSAAWWVVAVNAKLCVGSGVCVGLAPDLFQIGHGGTAEVREEVTPGSDAAEVAEYCPARAITVRKSANHV